MRTRLTFLAVLSSLALAAPVDDAAVRYASPTGDASAATTCPEADPCDINTAVEHTSVQNGDEVVMGPGIYTLGPTVTDEVDILKNVDVHGQAGQPAPLVNASTNTAFFSNQAGAKLSHVRVDHTGLLAGVIFTAGTLERVSVRSSAAGGFGCQLNAATARDSVCYSTGINGGGAGANTGSATFTIRLRNVTAVATGTMASSAGIRLSAGGPSTNATLDARSVIAHGGVSDVHVSEDTTSTMVATFEHSNYDTVGEFGNNDPEVTPPGSGTNQLAPPVFVDAANGDFHQMPNSPTVDAGAVDAFSGTLDIDGDPRDDGLGPDIGADELLDLDDDDDTVPDQDDNCPRVENPSQDDLDIDGAGDACDADDDGDGIDDALDACPLGATSGADTDGDGCKDSEDADDDGDTVPDATDNCPITANAGQANLDGDGEGDACDVDDDGDTVDDATDNCPVDANADQANGDGDGEGDACDADDDGDTVPDATDNCPLASNADQVDRDGDGLGAACDPNDVPTPPAADTDPPETTIVKGPKKRTTKTKARFKLASDEPGSTFECKLDKRAFAPCAATAKFKKLKPRKHKLQVRAMDAAGNVDPTPAKYAWKVLRTRHGR